MQVTKYTKNLMVPDSAFARRARKRAKHTTMTPVSSALKNRAREYGARKLKPSVSVLGSTASFVFHVPNRVLLDISLSSSEVRCATGRGENTRPKTKKGRRTYMCLPEMVLSGSV